MKLNRYWSDGKNCEKKTLVIKINLYEAKDSGSCHLVLGEPATGQMRPISYLFKNHHQRKRTEISTNQYVTLACWDRKNQRVKDKSENAQDINHRLTIMKGEVLQHFDRLRELKKRITPELLKRSYMGISDKQSTLKQLFGFCIQRFSEKVAMGKKSANSLKVIKSTQIKAM